MSVPQGSINHRINILYFLDSLCETSLLAKAYQPPHPIESSSWVTPFPISSTAAFASVNSSLTDEVEQTREQRFLRRLCRTRP